MYGRTRFCYNSSFKSVGVCSSCTLFRSDFYLFLADSSDSSDSWQVLQLGLMFVDCNFQTVPQILSRDSDLDFDLAATVCSRFCFLSTPVE